MTVQEIAIGQTYALVDGATVRDVVVESVDIHHTTVYMTLAEPLSTALAWVYEPAGHRRSFLWAHIHGDMRHP